MLFNWMDKFVNEKELISLSDNQSDNPMAKKNPEDQIRELKAENKHLEKALELEKLRAKDYDTMIDIAEQTFNIPIKNLAPNSKSATRGVQRLCPEPPLRTVWLQQTIVLQERRERVCGRRDRAIDCGESPRL